MGDGEGEGLFDIGMSEEGFIDFAGRDFFTAPIDQLFETAGEAQVAFFVETALVAGAEPAVNKGGAVGVFIVDVAGSDIGAADDDFTDVACGEEIAFGIHYGHLGACGEADEAGFVLAGRQGIAGHLVAGFGHAVGFEDGAAEGLFKTREDDGWEGGRGGADEAEFCVACGFTELAGTAEDPLVHGGDGGVPGGRGVAEPIEEMLGVDAVGADDGGLYFERGEEGGCQAVDVEERHDVEAAI